MRLLACFALIVVGCSGASSQDVSNGGEEEDELRSTEKGFEYTCTSPSGAMVLDVPTTKLVITDKHLRYENSFGQNLGVIDKTYKAPKNTSRVRYDGFETGEDCTLKVVADQSLLKGEASGNIRIQCSGDDFLQDVVSCKDKKATTLKLPKAPEPPPPAPATPPANARKWKCTTTSEYASLESEDNKPITMQVVDDSIRVNADFEYTGTRDRKYKARSGNWMSFENLDFGGDCSLTLIVDANALVSSTKTTTLKARCSGEGYQEDRYTCTTP